MYGNAPDGLADDFQGVRDKLVNVIVISLPHFSLVQGQNPLYELGRLHGISLDEPKTLMHLVRWIYRALVGLAEGIDSSHDIAEIVSQAHREHAQGLFPNRRREA